MTEIVAISGSLRSASSNTALLRAMAALAPAGVSVSVLEDAVGSLPHFSPDLDVDPLPPAVAELRARLIAADAVVICTPEYAHGMPGSLKNLFDWLVSTGELVDKPVAAISASPFGEGGGARAHASLLTTLRALSWRVVEEASLQVTRVKQKMAGDVVTDEETASALRRALPALV